MGPRHKDLLQIVPLRVVRCNWPDGVQVRVTVTVRVRVRIRVSFRIRVRVRVRIRDTVKIEASILEIIPTNLSNVRSTCTIRWIKNSKK
jgi:hypothetical protein